jgi:hypothetical protein
MVAQAPESAERHGFSTGATPAGKPTDGSREWHSPRGSVTTMVEQRSITVEFLSRVRYFGLYLHKSYASSPALFRDSVTQSRPFYGIVIGGVSAIPFGRPPPIAYLRPHRMVWQLAPRRNRCRSRRGDIEIAGWTRLVAACSSLFFSGRVVAWAGVAAQGTAGAAGQETASSTWLAPPRPRQRVMEHPMRFWYRTTARALSSC